MGLFLRSKETNKEKNSKPNEDNLDKPIVIYQLWPNNEEHLENVMAGDPYSIIIHLAAKEYYYISTHEKGVAKSERQTVLTLNDQFELTNHNIAKLLEDHDYHIEKISEKEDGTYDFITLNSYNQFIRDVIQSDLFEAYGEERDGSYFVDPTLFDPDKMVYKDEETNTYYNLQILEKELQDDSHLKDTIKKPKRSKFEFTTD